MDKSEAFRKQIEEVLNTVEDNAMAEAAKMSHSLFESFIAAGFSDAQALALVISLITNLKDKGDK